MLVRCIGFMVINQFAMSNRNLVKLRNIDYLGRGYNSITANPRDPIDTQFQQAVVDLQYTKNVESKDGQWMLPDNSEALQNDACTKQVMLSTILGSESYLKALDAEVSVAAGIPKLPISFTGSADYGTIMKGTSLSNNIYMEASALCLRYKALLQSEATLVLTENFITAVNGLKQETDMSKYIDFISNFGTHYVTEMSMGSKYIVRFEIQESKWAKMTNEKIDVGAGAELSFMKMGFGFKAGAKTETAKLEKFESYVSKKEEKYIGSRPATTCKFEDWAAESLNYLLPVRIKIKDLRMLLDEKYFPEIGQTKLDAMKVELKKAMDAYCEKAVDSTYCGLIKAEFKPDVNAEEKTTILPTKPQVPPTEPVGGPTTQATTLAELVVVEKKGKGVYYLDCPTGTKVLYCGIKAGYLDFYTNDDFRYAAPVSLSRCECYDNADESMVCQATCIRSTILQIQYKLVNNTLALVPCPSGYNVVGCSLFSKQIGYQRSVMFLPYSSEMCACGFVYGLCYAYCAPTTAITKYEIYKSRGDGSAKTTCPAGSYVLGCGLKVFIDEIDSWKEYARSVYRKSDSECACADSRTLDCYAICGVLKISARELNRYRRDTQGIRSSLLNETGTCMLDVDIQDSEDPEMLNKSAGASPIPEIKILGLLLAGLFLTGFLF